MLRRAGRHDGFLDSHARVDQWAELRRRQAQAQIGGVHIGVEGPAIGEVVSHLAEAGYFQEFVARVDKRRDVFESHVRYAMVAVILGKCKDPSGRRIQPDDRIGRQKPCLDAGLDQPDHSVAAHGAEPLVVDEQHAQCPVRRDRFGGNAAVHVGVATRLPHQRGSQVVEMLLGIATFGQGRISRDRG